MDKDQRKKVASAIREFAEEFQNAPMTGARIEVGGGQGGPTTGLYISVSPDPSGRSVTGMSITVDPAQMQSERGDQVETLHAAATALEQGTDPTLVKKILRAGERRCGCRHAGVL